MTKHIFVTGGVVSSLGKGLTAASVALLAVFATRQLPEPGALPGPAAETPLVAEATVPASPAPVAAPVADAIAARRTIPDSRKMSLPNQI